MTDVHVCIGMAFTERAGGKDWNCVSVDKASLKLSASRAGSTLAFEYLTSRSA